MTTIAALKNLSPRLRHLLFSIFILCCAACALTGPGETAALFVELEAALPEVIARGNSPSIQVAVVQGQEVWSQAYGENTSVEHVYMNASVQKVFTAAAVLQLVEKGLVDLDVDVGAYLPFEMRSPLAPDTPITARMLLAHRSGLDDFPYQFEWDTEDAFAPQYRPPAPTHVQAMAHEEFLAASLMPQGANNDPGSWIHGPNQKYHYSVSAYPLLRYLIGRVSGQGYEAYMREHIFLPLEMTNSGFSAAEFSGRHAMPYTQIDGQNIELPYRFRNAAEHDAALSRNNGNPYILQIDTEPGGALLYYGASHTSEPDHPQVADIESQWAAFAPSVALYEGRSGGYFYGALIEPFAGLPEPALVHKLARQNSIPLYSLEPGYEDEVAELLKVFQAEQIALYFFLRVYSSEAGGAADEELALELLGKRTDVEGLRGALTTLAEVDAIWQRDFPGQGDWRVHRDEPGYLADISDLSRQIRGEHMARILINLVEQGERVFAVVGSGHVIRQEGNLRAAFGQEPAWDQPGE